LATWSLKLGLPMVCPALKDPEVQGAIQEARIETARADIFIIRRTGSAMPAKNNSSRSNGFVFLAVSEWWNTEG
jgi:hypothetical protein